MFASAVTHISPHLPLDMPQKSLGNTPGHFLYTSASCMDLGQFSENDFSRQRRASQHLQPTPHHHQQRTGQSPHSSPLPQTQWTNVPPVYRPRNWVDPEDVSPVLTRQPQRIDSVSTWRSRAVSPAPSAATSGNRTSERTKKHRAPRIFRRRDTEESPQEQPFDVTMLYPQMSPYQPDRMSTYSAPEQLEHPQRRFASQPNSPGFAPNWSALPSRNDEPSPISIPRSPTYPPAGRRRMHSTSGIGDAAFDDEQDFRLFVEATAGLPPDIGFSHPRTGQSPTHASQSPLRRAATTQRTGYGETSPVAETPATMLALRDMAAIPQANQTYRPQRSSDPPRQQQQGQGRQQPQPQARQDVNRPTRPQATRSTSSRDRLAASASGLDLWLPSPVSPESAHPTDAPLSIHSIPRRAVGSSTYTDVSPLTPAAPHHFQGLDREIQRQLEELDLEEAEGDGEVDDELPDYAQSQAEAQAERRAEAARRAQELQERWLRRGR